MPRQELRTLLRHIRRAAAPQGHGTLTDAQLLERFVTHGDEAAFEVLLWRHGAMVWSVCRRVLRHEHDAEDAFQAAFLILVRKAGSIGRGEAVGGWLYKVAYRVALEARARAVARARREQPLVEPAAAETVPELVWRDLRPLLDEEVSRLPDRYRAPFVLCYLEGKTNEEAARQLGCPKGTVLSRLARARERLRSRLTRRGLTLSAAALATALSEQAMPAAPAALADNTLRAALVVTAGRAAAGALSAPVAALTQGALRAMFWNKLKTALVFLVVAGLAGSGATTLARWTTVPSAAAAAQAERPPEVDGGVAEPRAEDPLPAKGQQVSNRLTQDLNVPAQADPCSPAGFRMQGQKGLKELAVAMHKYHEDFGHFPAPAIYGRDGKPLLSWRVALLPYLGETKLYQEFRQDEPWDSPPNKLLLGRMPALFDPAGSMRWEHATQAYYQVFVGKGAVFEKYRGVRLAEITDGASNTLLLVETGPGVPWTKPEDLTFDPDRPLPPLNGPFDPVLQVAFADGSVHAFKKEIDEAALRAVITRSGGEVVNIDRLSVPQPLLTSRLPEPNLKRQNERLRAGLEQARTELAELNAELAAAKRAASDQESLRLAEENAQLERTLAATAKEIQAIRDELRRLKQIGSKRPGEQK